MEKDLARTKPDQIRMILLIQIAKDGLYPIPVL